MNMLKFLKNYYGTLKDTVDKTILTMILYLILTGKEQNNYQNQKFKSD